MEVFLGVVTVTRGPFWRNPLGSHKDKDDRCQLQEEKKDEEPIRPFPVVLFGLFEVSKGFYYGPWLEIAFDLMRGNLREGSKSNSE